MAARFNLGQFLTGVMGQHPARVSAFLESLDDATAARLMAAAEAGDNRTVLKAMADQTWGMSKPKATPAPEPTGSRSPMPFEDRVSRDPNIRATINEAGIPPALRAGVEAGDPKAIMEAYRGAVKRGGSTEDSIRALAKPADQVAAERIAGQFDRVMGFDNPPPARQMELGFGEEPTGLIPYGSRGPGVPVGGSSAPGVPFNPGTDLIPATPRRIGGQTRALSTQEPGGRPYRVVDEVKPKGNRGAKLAGAAAAAGAAGAAYWAAQNQTDIGSGAAANEEAVQSGGEADLVEESRPAPKVAATQATPEPKVAQAPVDYSLQARALINRLNDMRRAAGGEVPEAPQMMAEINRLIALGNEQRRNPQYSHPQADPARDPYQQARDLIAQVNQMYQRGMTPSSPEVQKIMARVRQLQAQGDAIRNRRAG